MALDLSHLVLDDVAFGHDRFAWRLPMGGFTWRLATIADAPELIELWDEMDRKAAQIGLGKQDRPNLFNPMPVILTLVAIDDETGKIRSALYGEAVIDWTMIGTDRKVARSIDSLHTYLFMHLFSRGIRVARVLVPMSMRRHMGKLLPQMTDITQSFAQFVCRICP